MATGIAPAQDQSAVATGAHRQGNKKADAHSDFLRFTEDDENGRLETAIVRYTHPNGHTVDLIGVVHLGDTTYYEKLSELMEGYDALLYEMVGDPEALQDREKLAASQNPLRMVMRMAKGILKLDYQLDAIDYTKENFVHADLTLDAFSGLMEERGETMFTILQNAMRQNATSASNSTTSATATPFDLAPLIGALASPDSASALKLVVAKQFDQADLMLDAAETENGTVILTERNKHVIKVIDEQVNAGKRKLGILYGAAHLVDLERRLRASDYRSGDTNWLTAWDIPKPKKKAADADSAPPSPAE